MKQQVQEPNRFLENQARIMEARRLQAEQRAAEAEAKSLQVGEAEAPLTLQKTFDPNAPTITIESANPFTGEVHTRTVDVSRPTPQRIVKPAPLTLEEIKQGLIEAGNEIDSAREQYDSNVSSLDAFYSESNALRQEIADLQARLAEKQARLNDLESAGTPRDIYAVSVVAAERQVMSWATSLLATLSEQAAQRIHGISFDELSKDGQRDAQARYRKALQKYQSNFYMRLGRDHKRATAEQVGQRATELLDDIDNLLTSDLFTGAN